MIPTLFTHFLDDSLVQTKKIPLKPIIMAIIANNIWNLVTQTQDKSFMDKLFSSTSTSIYS